MVGVRDCTTGKLVRMLNRDVLPGGVYAIGPLAVVSALFLSLTSGRVWSRNVGETSCAWRTDYSPDGRAFSIWAVIYVATISSVIAQLTNGVTIFDWWVNFLWALAWALCALWTPLFDAESPGALRAAAFIIVAAAACSTAATALSRQWVVDNGEGGVDWRGHPFDEEGLRTEQVSVGSPLSLLAGWLTVAAAINVGIAHKASDPGASAACVRVEARRDDESERDYRNRRRVLYREAYAKAEVRVSIVPLLLAVFVGGLSTLMRDPVYAAPLMWGIVNLRAFPSCEYVMALLVCACGFAGAIVRIVLE